jgi:hypothetical protein
VAVQAAPSGAEVRLDGGSAMPAPASFRNVVAGSHTVRVTRTGHVAAEHSFEFSGQRDTLLQIALRAAPVVPPAPSTGIFAMKLDPRGDVYLDGTQVGFSADSVRQVVPEGDHTYLVRSPITGKKTFGPTRFRIGPGQTQTFYAMDRGYLLVTSEGGPPADIVVDGKPTGQKTPAVLKLDAGMRKVSLVLDGFRVKEGERFARVSPDASDTLSFTLVPR